MPSGKNWINFLYINLAFVLFIIGVRLISSINDIKANWPEYRCNPMYMPLSDNVQQDFVYCVQNIQNSSMGYLLQPLTFLTSSITSVLGEFVEEINYIREMFNKIRTMFTSIVQSIFGIFLNLIIEFQKIIISIKDLVGKTIGTMVAFMYVLDGSLKTMNSAWNGPSGQIVRSIGQCFHPLTKIKLKNGMVVCMNEINLGDVLESGSVVESTMKINNTGKLETIYAIKNAGGGDIYVTGSHSVFDKEKNEFIKVCDYAKAKKVNIDLDWFSCLITSDHKIQIGDEIFWDWEDHLLQK